MNIRSGSALDRAAKTLMAILLALTVVLLIVGDRTAPYVREFSWSNQLIGAEDTAFALRFSRAMDRKKVESQLLFKSSESNAHQPLTKALPGKFSWAGKRMLYTINSPVPYGGSYEISLQNVTATSNDNKPTGLVMTPFNQKFATRDLLFGYIGTAGENRGRLMVKKAGDQQAIAITPPEFLVKDFRFTPTGNEVVFAAVPANNNPALLASQQIYRYGLQNANSALVPTLILDSKDYQNIKFDLSPDGKILVVHRVGIKNPSDFGIWAIKLASGQVIQRLSQGGSFVLTPDSAGIAVSEGQGVAIKTLQPGTAVADFLPKFGRLLNFAPTGAAALLEKYNDDYSRDLFLVTNQGVEKKLLNIKGEIQAAQFTTNGQGVYCIVAETDANTTESAQYSGQPYLMAIDVKTTKIIKLLKLPQQQGISLSLAPDGRSLLFDQLATIKGIGQGKRLTAPDGQSIEQGKLWQMKLPPSIEQITTNIAPQDLNLAGYNPRWAP
jgi:dipeptidyl aminopeptidase/acylaminoacyl peptidase